MENRLAATDVAKAMSVKKERKERKEKQRMDSISAGHASRQGSNGREEEEKP